MKSLIFAAAIIFSMNVLAQDKEKTTQCKGVTKAKTQCKHKTKNANSYCFQHQPK